MRTPVSNLLTQTQVTLSKARSADDYREILASNAEEFERLSRTISDMLFLAKADNDQVIPSQESIELAEEVAELLEYYEILAEEKAITLSQSGRGRVTGDRLMLRRAISNLLSNAIRHTPNGGSIATRICHASEGSTVLTVENTGKTISPEHLPRLFDRFYRVDSSRFRTTENAGLGLAITRSILQAHGGGACQESCRLNHAANPCLLEAVEYALTTQSRSGLSVTVSMEDQFRVLPDQRFGLRSRASV